MVVRASDLGSICYLELLHFPEHICHVAQFAAFIDAIKLFMSEKPFVWYHRTIKYPFERANMSLSYESKSLEF